MAGRTCPRRPLGRKKNALSLTDEMIKIIIGSGERTMSFSIHRSLLIARSKFFTAALSESFEESQTKTVMLPGDDPEVFALYQQLIYQHRIPLLNERIPEDKQQTPELLPQLENCCKPTQCGSIYRSLVALYILGIRLQDVASRKSAINSMIMHFSYSIEVQQGSENGDNGPCLPDSKTIRIMYQHTRRHCPGREFLVDCYVYYSGPHDLVDIYYHPMGFLHSLSQKLISLRSPSRDKKMMAAGQFDEVEDALKQL